MTTPEIKVYGFVPYDRSGKVTWMLEELGVPYQFIGLDYKTCENDSPTHLARHPMGAVPVLEMGDVTLFESNAICWYLAERFPQGNLIPDVGTPERAKCLQWLTFCDATLGQATSSRWPIKNLPEYPTDLQALDGKPAREFLATTKAEIEEFFQDSLKALENHLSSRDWLCDRFTLADIAISYSLSWTNAKGDLKNYPFLKDYLARNQARPAAIHAKVFEKNLT